MMMMKDSDT